MIIREAMIADAGVIMRGARELADFSKIPLFPEGEKEFLHTISQIVTNDNVTTLLAENDGEVIGAIGIAFIPYIWNPSVIIGEELFWWTFENAPMKAGKMLFDEAIRRIDARNGIPYFKSLQHSPKGMDRLYKREGFILAEKGWMRF